MSLVADKITQLCSWGTSRAVRIPKDLCERLGVDVGARLSMHVVHDERGSFLLVRPGFRASPLSRRPVCFDRRSFRGVHGRLPTERMRLEQRRGTRGG